MILGLGISYRNQGNLVLAKDKHLDHWSRIHSMKIGPHIHVFFFFFYKGDTSYQWKTESLSTNDTESLSERIKKILTLVSNHI